MKVKVLREFRDGSDFSKLYKTGDEVVITDKARVERLVTLKLVEILDDGKATDPNENSVFGAIDISKSVAELTTAISAEEDVDALKNALKAELSKEKPRTSVEKLINERIATLANADLDDGKVTDPN